MYGLLILPGWISFAIIACYLTVLCHESKKPGIRVYLSLVVSALVAVCMGIVIVHSAHLNTFLTLVVSLFLGPLAVANIIAFYTRNKGGKEDKDKEEIYSRCGRVVCCTIALLITGLIMVYCSRAFLPARMEHL